MYDRDERAQTFASWMMASGARLDPPDLRQINHLVALRDAQREAARPSATFARLAARFGRPTRLAGSPTATTNATTCCVPA